MSNDTQSPNVEINETNVQNNLSAQSGYPNMSNEKTFLVQNGLEVQGDAVVSGTVTATSFIGDGSQLTGISGGGSGPQSEIINGNAFVRIEDGDPGSDSDAPVNLKMVSVGGTDLWDVDVLTINDVSITAGDDVHISAADNVNITSVDYMDLVSEDDIYLTAGGKIDLESSDYIELNADVYVRDHPLRLQDDFAGVNPGMESFVQDLDLATSTEVPSAIAVKSVTDDLQSQIDNFSGGGGLDSAGVQLLIDDDLTGSGLESVQIGVDASATGSRGVAVGPRAAATNQNNIAIGNNAGDAGSDPESIAIGAGAKTGTQTGDTGSIAIGAGAGEYFQGPLTVALGKQAGRGGGNDALKQQSGAVAVGYQSGYSEQGENGIAIGREAGWTNQGDNSIGIGYKTGKTGQGANNVSINATGTDVSRLDQFGIDIRTSDSGSVTYSTDSDWVFGATVNAPAFVGDGSGLTGLPSGGGLDSAAVEAIIDSDLVGAESPNSYTMKIGANASRIAIGSGAVSTYVNSMSIGNNAGRYINGGSGQVVIGDAAGGAASGGAAHNIVAIGTGASTDLSATQYETVSIGYNAGRTNMGNYAVAIGSGASISSAGQMSIGLGYNAKASGSGSIAIGGGGAEATGNNTIAIGEDANATTQYGIDIRTSAAGSLTYDTTNDWTFGAGVTMTDLVASGATVVFNNLPTVDPVNAGQLWNDAGTMKISAG